jgi:hypothetical protein
MAVAAAAGEGVAELEAELALPIERDVLVEVILAGAVDVPAAIARSARARSAHLHRLRAAGQGLVEGGAGVGGLVGGAQERTCSAATAGSP